MWSLLIAAYLAALVTFSLGFVFAYRYKRIDIVDVYWPVSFMVIAVAALLFAHQPTLATYIVTTLVLVWGFRLSRHIAQRFVHAPEQDARYTALTRGWDRRLFWLRVYIQIFLFQSILACIVALPVVVVASSVTYEWSWAMLGVVVWLVGFAYESIGDNQLADFLANPKNRGKLMTTGLWGMTRHPNYFGEMMMWWGVWCVSVGMNGWWFGLLGPVTISLLLRFVSGVPLAEQRSSAKPGWAAYAKRTPVLFPRFRS